MITGIHASAISTMTTVAMRPVRTSCDWLAFGFHFWYRSTVNSVEQALNTPASDPISAESSPATTMPRIPGGSRYCTSMGKAPFDTAGIALPSGPIICASSGILPLLARAIADQAGDDEQVHREQLQECREDAALAGDGLVGSAQRALDDVLVGAPIPEADDGRAEEHAQPRESCR